MMALGHTMRKALLLIVLALVASEASAQSSSCKTIADDKERLACYDKAASGEESADEYDETRTPQTPEARSAYVKKLEHWFLSNGISMAVYILDKPKESQAFLKKYPPPYLVIQGYLTQALVFQIASKAQVLRTASNLGFKVVKFNSLGGSAGGHWFYDVSKGVPQCDEGHRLCLY